MLLPREGLFHALCAETGWAAVHSWGSSTRIHVAASIAKARALT